MRMFEYFILAFVGVMFLGYVAYPIGAGILGSLSDEAGFSIAHYLAALDFRNAANVEAIFNSVLVSVLSVIGGGLLGFFVAFALTQFTPRWQKFLFALAVLPVAMPPLVGVISFLLLLGEGGLIPRLLMQLFGLAKPVMFLEGFGAIVILHVYAFHVYFLLFVSAALRQMDAAQLEAAAALGASSLRTTIRIILPHLKPAFFGAAILTFMASMASFSAPFIFGGGMHFLTTLIYDTKLNGELDLAAAQSVLLMIVSGLFFVGLNLFQKQEGRFASGKGTPRSGRLLLSGAGKHSVKTLLVLTLVIELLPVLTIAAISFVREGSWTWQLLPTGFTVENYTRLLSDPDVFLPVRNSVAMGCLTVVASVLLGTGAAYTITKGMMRRFRGPLDFLLSLPFSIPGTVVAIYLIVAYSAPTVFSGGQVLLGTFWILPLAYFIRTYPLLFRSVSSSLGNIDESVLEASSTLGAGSFIRLRRIILPIVLPSIVGGSLLVMNAALGEFVSSILLYTHSNRPLSIEILSQLRGYNLGSAASYGVVLFVLVLFLAFLSDRLMRRHDRDRFEVGI